MKKTMYFIAFFAVLIISVSAHTGRVSEAAKGYNAPLFELTTDSDSTFSLADMKGRYVLLTLWNSENPGSRIDVNRYQAFARNADKERFCLLSVNFDRSERLFREIVRMDNLSAESQFNVQGAKAREIAQSYNLSAGYNAYLIDPVGKIVAVNPSDSMLASIIN